MIVSDAQRDLRRAYVGGGPGVLISALVWLVAAFIERTQGIGAGFAALFFGGMLIFPGAKLMCRLVFRRANESPHNPLGMIALESTIAMLGGLFAAWLFLPVNPALVFPLAAIAVGTHYAVFKTVYGDRLYWLLGAVLTAIGLGDIFVAGMQGTTAWLVAAAELVFALILIIRAAEFGNSTVAGTIR